MRRTTRGAIAVASAGLAFCIGAGSASGSATWTSKPGGAVTATSANVGITDKFTGAPRQGVPNLCDSSMKATFKSGSGLPGRGIRSVTSAAFTNCVWVLGLTVTMTARHLPWNVSVFSYDAANEVSSGTITGIHLTIRTASCTAVVDGTGPSADDGQISFRYTNSTHELTLPNSGGNLHYYSVNGCMELVGSGDPVNLHGTYTMTPGQTFTSP